MKISTMALGSVQMMWNTSSTLILCSKLAFSLSRMRMKILATNTSNSDLRWSLKPSIRHTKICSDTPVT